MVSISATCCKNEIWSWQCGRKHSANLEVKYCSACKFCVVGNAKESGKGEVTESQKEVKLYNTYMFFFLGNSDFMLQ